MADAADSSPAGNAAPAYRVLARKYRPTHFGELIGQEPMVRTLRNAFQTSRIPQAWMLTGVRGVGKTTTARILARALNYQLEGEPARPTVDFTELGVHCAAIMESRHVDVIEMDAASHTSINDVREIIDASRYKPVAALYKIYIIDEVHMLSIQAFNGLLKTLEEPPEHVKFVFATTEIRKVPVTVLSRCQRFDLRRIDNEALAAHLAAVAQREGIVADEDALQLVARAAEGSVRDALSLLDQAIAHAGGTVTAEGLRDMLGLADRARIVDLFELVMKGDAAAALAELSAQYEVGADPSVILSDLANFTHQVTRQKVMGASADPGEPEDVRRRADAFAAGLGVAALSRMWQALLTGITEVQGAPKPEAAAEMVLVRLCYMASLPEPDAMPLSEAPRAPHGAAQANGPQRAPGAPRTTRADHADPGRPPARSSQANAGPENLHEVAALVGAVSVKLKLAVERYMRPKTFQRGRIEVTLEEGAPPGAVGELGAKLTELTGERWIVTVSEGADAPTLRERHEAEQAELKESVKDEPLVRALLEQFADAEIVEVREVTPDAMQKRANGE